MFTVPFWIDALERAIRAAAWSLLGALGGTLVVTDKASWGTALIASGIAALSSILASIVASRVGAPESPSFVKEAA